MLLCSFVGVGNFFDNVCTDREDGRLRVIVTGGKRTEEEIRKRMNDEADELMRLQEELEAKEAEEKLRRADKPPVWLMNLPSQESAGGAATSPPTTAWHAACSRPIVPHALPRFC